jgi:NTP pyrophosphatase (non-canonical NTP hydrolase)
MALVTGRRQPVLVGPAASGEDRDQVDRRLTVTVCGSFRRDPDALRRDCDLLAAHGCERLSPSDLDFVGVDRGFVFSEPERGVPPRQIESGHLRAMERSDFVWLHAPDGYIGRSSAMELGFARALGVPVFSSAEVADPAFEGIVQVVDDPTAAVGSVRTERPPAAAEGLRALQDYYARVSVDRGWAHEQGSDTLERLREETEELAEALGTLADAPGAAASAAVALELADVQLYVVHLANVLGLNLAEAVKQKEQINSVRFDPRSLKF